MNSGIRLDGKVAIVTGSNGGIGLETARDLARKGARVILACRSSERGAAACDELRKDTGSTEVVYQHLDLANLASVKQFAEDFNKNETRLDILVNNAGVFTSQRRLTDDGLELDFGVNHIGHFLLTNLLLEKLKASAPSRIVTVSSKAHEYSDLNFNDLQTSSGWSALKAYGRSKTANVLFSTHLASVLQGTGVTSYCLHPGVIATELGRDFEGSTVMKCFRLAWSCFRGQMTSPTDGAKTSLYCCLESALSTQTGLYYSKCKPARPKSHATNPRSAARLWLMSADLCAGFTTQEQLQNIRSLALTNNIIDMKSLTTDNRVPKIPKENEKVNKIVNDFESKHTVVVGGFEPEMGNPTNQNIQDGMKFETNGKLIPSSCTMSSLSNSDTSNLERLR